MKRKKCIVFDFDMTLADSAGVIAKLLNETAAHFGHERQPHYYIMRCIGNTHEKMLSHVTSVTDEVALLKMGDHYREIIQDEMPRLTTFFPYVDTCVSELFSHGVRIGCLSIKPTNLLVASLQKYELMQYFEVVKGREDVPAQKPDPRALFSVVDELGLPKEEIFYVGDSLVDEETARRAGVDFGAMLLGGTRREQFDPTFTTAFYKNWTEFYDNVVKELGVVKEISE